MPLSFAIYEDKENGLWSNGGRPDKNARQRSALVDVSNIGFAPDNRPLPNKKLSLTESNKKDEASSDTPLVTRKKFNNALINSIEDKRPSRPIKKCGINIYDVYKKDIYKYLRGIEGKYVPKATFMCKQTFIDAGTRSTLIDWLVEVALEFSLEDEVLFLATSYVDKFLSRFLIKKNKLQLLGAAAMYTAAKYECIYPPPVLRFSYITAYTYSVDQILGMEMFLLKVLNFCLSPPTIMTFFNLTSNEMDLSEETKLLGKFLCELILIQGDPYFEFSPSLVSSSVIGYSRHCVNRYQLWTKSFVKLTGYTAWDITLVTGYIYQTHLKSLTHAMSAVIQKYYDKVKHIKPKLYPLATIKV